MFDYLIVGAGFAGSVLAERLAAGSGKKVLLCDKRPHIGGNAYDHYNEAGILVQSVRGVGGAGRPRLVRGLESGRPAAAGRVRGPASDLPR